MYYKNGAWLHSSVYTVTVFSILTFISLYFLLLLPDQSNPIPVFLWVDLAISMILVIYGITSKSFKPIFFMSSIYMSLFFIMPGILHVGYGMFPFFGARYSSESISGVSFIIFVFLSVFLLVYLLTISCFRKLIFSESLKNISKVETNFNANYAVVFMVLLSITFAIIVGPSTLIVSRGDAYVLDNLSPTELIFTSISRVSSYIAFSYFLINVVTKKIWYKKLNIFYLVVLLAIFFGFNSPLAVPRFVIASYGISLIFTFFALSNSLRFLLFFLFAILEVTVFPYFSFIARGAADSIFYFSPVPYLTTSGDLDGLQSMISVFDMVQNKGFSFGNSIASAVLFFIPRDFWPSKSLGTGVEAAYFMGFPFTNISCPLPSEFYVDFGFFGLTFFTIIFSFFCGVCDVLYEIFINKLQIYNTFIIAVMSGYVFIVLRGSLVGVLGPLLVSFGLLCFCNWAFRNRSID